jgi:hypothetical protein
VVTSGRRQKKRGTSRTELLDVRQDGAVAHMADEVERIAEEREGAAVRDARDEARPEQPREGNSCKGDKGRQQQEGHSSLLVLPRSGREVLQLLSCCRRSKGTGWRGGD